MAGVGVEPAVLQTIEAAASRSDPEHTFPSLLDASDVVVGKPIGFCETGKLAQTPAQEPMSSAYPKITLAALEKNGGRPDVRVET